MLGKMQTTTTTAVFLVLATLWNVAAHAAPANSADDIDRLLTEKGLLNQIDHVRQNVTHVTHKASELVFNAIGFMGVPYKWGGNTAETGFDCSGFVRSMYQQTVGLVLPRKAEQQAAATQQIAKTDLQPGDLVFFNTMRRAFSHVGIYIGNGKFIHAPKTGSHVRVDNLGGSYWERRFDGARRVATGRPPASSPIPLSPVAPPAMPVLALTKAVPAIETVFSPYQALSGEAAFR